jgi:hypothetical protein
MQFPFGLRPGANISCQSFFSASPFLFLLEEISRKMEVANED